MRLHILGICGTFMSGLAMLAKQCGHDVTGSDMNVYPPMSTQLINQGITLKEGYDPKDINPDIDCVVVGNVISRGNPVLEYILSSGIPYQSGPEWLYNNVLKTRWVLAVAGTHGKTTTTSLLAHILDQAGLEPGFLIGGIAENFAVSARLGKSPYFVIEADEYDTAFCDKRSKFIHYRPKTLILNNLEYDHADIFPDLEAIKQQFHYLIRTIPGNGRIIWNEEDKHLAQVLAKGYWSETQTFGGDKSLWQSAMLSKDGSTFNIMHNGELLGEVHWGLLGKHNVANAVAALAGANHAHVDPAVALKAIASFKNVKRRLEVKYQSNHVVIYDDFAHHPTAIKTTLAGLRAKIGRKARMIAVIEFGSYTMRHGIHKRRMQEALHDADMVICKSPPLEWGLKEMLAGFKQPTALYEDVDMLVKNLTHELRSGDHVIIMSNSGFGGIQNKLINALEKS